MSESARLERSAHGESQSWKRTEPGRSRGRVTAGGGLPLGICLGGVNVTQTWRQRTDEENI